MKPIRTVIDIVIIAGAVVVLAGCDEEGQASFTNVLANLGASDPVGDAQRASFVEPTPEPAPAEPCVVPPAKFRELWCNPATDILEPIP